MSRKLLSAVALLGVWAAPTVARGQCEPEWLGGFGRPGVEGGGNLGPRVRVILPYSLNGESGWIAAGSFSRIGDVDALGVAAWTGGRWQALVSSGFVDAAISAVVFDDGSGPALYMGGRFVLGGVAGYNIARWDGSAWSPVGEGLGRTISWPTGVYSLCSYDDGQGPALYAMGFFDRSGNTPLRNMAKWDGGAWSDVGGGADYVIASSVVHDDGSGPALYVGGSFAEAGGLEVESIARWDGKNWSGLGCYSGATYRFVDRLIVHDMGDGPALYAAGLLVSLDCAPAHSVAKWDGESWESIGDELSGGSGEVANGLLGVQEPSGPALYATGLFDAVAGQPARVARWDGEEWTPFGTDFDERWVQGHTLAEVDMGEGPEMVLGGYFSHMDGWPANGLARWNGARWGPIDNGMTTFVAIPAMAVADAGGGAALFASSGQSEAKGIVTWQGGRWVPLGENVERNGGEGVQAIVGFDEGAGPRVYVGGGFTQTESGAVNIASWDGASWHELAGGTDGPVDSLAVYDDGGGAGLYAGGGFAQAGNVPASNIARWRGGSWAALGEGVDGEVRAMAVYDDGNGSALFVGGAFTMAGQQPVQSVARWDGSQWADVGGGVDGTIESLAVFDDGGGPVLYAGGSFMAAGGLPADNIARWDGQNWSPVDGGTDDLVTALQVHDDGGGARLYAAGLFVHAGGVEVNQIAGWDGVQWSALNKGFAPLFAQEPQPQSLASFDDGSGPALWVGGPFRHAGGYPSWSIAKWGCPAADCDPCDLNCDGTIDAFDVEPFIARLVDPMAPACAPCAGDVNGDGMIDAFDIEPFIACLTP